MKKITALLLAISMIFLCACSNQNKEETKETTTAATETTKAVKYITEWESELIPADFPPPPEKAYDELVYVLPAENEFSGRCHDIIRLIFSCPENEFYNFTNQFINQGFIGGMKKVNGGTLYEDGFWGCWKGDDYSVVINDDMYEDNGDLKICLEITENFPTFPEALKDYYPEFNFPARTMGYYVGYNTDGIETNDFQGKFEHVYWQWHVRFKSAFVGVTLDDFYAYCDSLGAVGFKGAMSTRELDGFTIISCDLIKDETIAAFMIFNQTLKTLDIVYTNDPKSIMG